MVELENPFQPHRWEKEIREGNSSYSQWVRGMEAKKGPAKILEDPYQNLCLRFGDGEIVFYE